MLKNIIDDILSSTYRLRPVLFSPRQRYRTGNRNHSVVGLLSRREDIIGFEFGLLDCGGDSLHSAWELISSSVVVERYNSVVQLTCW